VPPFATFGGVDLTSSAGTMTMIVLNAVAQFERDLLIERTQSGLKRAKAEGKTLGLDGHLRHQRPRARPGVSFVSGWCPDLSRS
jgi:putative DNA-invertase from lambdoid prophage Rac